MLTKEEKACWRRQLFMIDIFVILCMTEARLQRYQSNAVKIAMIVIALLASAFLIVRDHQIRKQFPRDTWIVLLFLKDPTFRWNYLLFTSVLLAYFCFYALCG